MTHLLPVSLSHHHVFQSAAVAACLLGASFTPADAQQRPVRAQNNAAGQLPYELPDEPIAVLQGQSVVGGPLPAPDKAEEETPPAKTPSATPRPQKTPTAPRRGPASVAGVSIDGLSDVEAQKRLRSVLAPKLATPLVLKDGSKSFTLPRAQLGASIPYTRLVVQARRSGGDVPLRFTVDAQRAQTALRKLAPRVNGKAEPFSLDLDAQNRVIVRGGQSGTLDVAASAQRVREALEAQPPRSQAELIIAQTSGMGKSRTTHDLSRVRYLLADFSTPYDASIRGRTNNLRMAAELVNGTVVADGAVFSTNKAYRPAQRRRRLA
jgi:vancomycin resistance protein YoaR